MENRVEVSPETRKEWTAPGFKKIDVELLTAGGAGSTDDGFGKDFS